MTLAYKLGPLELCFTPDCKETVAESIFVARYGYAPDKVYTALGLLRLGPVYTVRSTASETLEPGAVILHAGIWHTLADVDGDTVLTANDMLLTLPAMVTVRS